MKHLVVIVIFVISFTANPLYAGQNEYDECLLEYLPGVESGDAVIEIQGVCERKHL